jgi:hypothetical protein
MKTPDDKSIERLQELLENKSFMQLNASEQQWVIEVFGEATYEEYKAMIQSSRKVFADEFSQMKAIPDIKEQLLSRFEEVHSQNKGIRVSPLHKILQYKVRLVVALPAAIGLVMIAFAVFLKLIQENQTDGITITKLDTIYIEKSNKDSLAFNSSESVPEKEIQVKKANPARKTAASLPDELQGQIRNLEVLTDVSHKSKRGSSARDDSTLLKLFVTVN